MECVTECEPDEIAVNDEQFWNKPFCRGFNYYVDPDSTEVIELGTKSYPYKNIGLPFVEILNYHSHSTDNITLYLKEHTINMMLWKSNYIINMTQLTIASYSEISTITPSYADIIVKDDGVTMITSKSLFVVLKHNTLRLSDILNEGEGNLNETSKGRV